MPPGGGAARVWYQSPDLDGLYSVNGMQFDRQSRLVFVQTFSQQGGSVGRGVLYRLEVGPNGNPGRRETLATAGFAADGIALARSGNIYVATTNQAPIPHGPEVPGDSAIEVFAGDGTHLADLPSLETAMQADPPLDGPASLAFDGSDLLISNHALNSLNPEHFAVLGLGTQERGLPLTYPFTQSRAPAKRPNAKRRRKCRKHRRGHRGRRCRGRRLGSAR